MENRTSEVLFQARFPSVVFTLCLPYPGLSGHAGLGPTLPDISSSCPQMQLRVSLKELVFNSMSLREMLFTP